MVVLAADHHILNPEVLRAAVQRAVEVARERRGLVLFGLTPDGPKTQYGYIIPRRDPDAALPGRPPTYAVERFHEKPPEELARQYLAAGCFWNSGMFTWRADVVLEELQRHAPNVAESVRSALGVADDAEAFADAYRRIPPISIDHALLEHSNRLVVIESGIERIDLGTWATMSAIWPRDESGNVSVGDVVAIDVKNTTQYTTGRLVATIGLDDIIVVATDDVVLVCDRKRAAEVNELVKRLEQHHATKWL